MRKKNLQRTDMTMEKQEPRLILIGGSEKGIYTFFLALSLYRNYGKKSVLVIDNSYSQDLFHSVPEEGGIGTIDDIPVLSSRRYTPAIMSQFDYTIVYSGYSEMDPEYAKACDIIFLLSDYSIASQDYLENVKIPKGKPVRFMFDPKPNNKLKEDTILSQMKHYNVPAGSEYYILFVDERDIGGYQELQNSGYVMLKSMSKAFQKIIGGMSNDVQNSSGGALPEYEEEE